MKEARMKKLLLILLILGSIACAKKEAPATEEAPADAMEAVADSAAAEMEAAEEAPAE